MKLLTSVRCFSAFRLLGEVAMAIALVGQIVPARAASSHEVDSPVVSREHANWPSPESLVRDLRSVDEGVSLVAE